MTVLEYVFSSYIMGELAYIQTAIHYLNFVQSGDITIGLKCNALQLCNYILLFFGKMPANTSVYFLGP